MKNLERYKDIIVDIFSKEYLYRSTYEEWYRLKEYQKEIEEYIQTTFGYTLSVTTEIGSLNKYSVVGSSSKGIDTLVDLDEYIILPLILNYLEDKYDKETILISEIAEHIINNFPEKRDWENRRVSSKLVRVLKYCQDKNFIKKLDGSEDGYEKSEEEVLYENTGISKYFMQRLAFDLEGLNVEEIEKYNYKELNEVQVLRRGLLENFVITKNFPYFDNLIELRDEIEDSFEELFNMRLIVFKELAYLLRGEESAKVSKSFPSVRNNLERIGLKFFKYLDTNEYRASELLEKFKEYKDIYKPTFTKGNLDKKEELLLSEILKLGRRLNIIEEEKRSIRSLEEDSVDKKQEEWILLTDYIDHFTIDILNTGEENE